MTPEDQRLTFSTMTQQIHGTCVEVSGAGVLLRGPSGSGKSDLALRLIDGGAQLVADDRVDLEVRNGLLTASAPAALAGMIEVRGLGVMRIPAVSRTFITLIIDLVEGDAVERMPEPMTCRLLGVEAPLMRLHGRNASAAAWVRLAVEGAKRPALTAAAS